MSNHTVGNSLDNLTKAVFELYDQKEMSAVAANKMIELAWDVVGDCDGNSYEAFESSIGHRCAHCFSSKKTIYDMSELDYSDDLNDPDLRNVFEKIYYDLPFCSICEDCFIKLVTSYKDAETAKRLFNLLKKYPYSNEK